MKFYTGIHQPADARHVPRAFISAHRLATRRSGFESPDWIMDSGSFSTIAMHGGFPGAPEDYAHEALRWKALVPTMQRAVTQDYMCEPAMLERTGETVLSHQTMTIGRFRRIRAICGPLVMPVLQGYEPADYARHAIWYGYDIPEGAWVGVGSVCKRQGNASAIAEVLRAILDVRPDLRLHGFGVKTTSLACASVRDRLYSADSMAWSYAARKQGRNGNSPLEAAKFAERIQYQPVQRVLF